MKKILYGLLVCVAFTSCEDYLDVNNDQSNNPLAENLAPNQMLAGAISNYTNHQTTTLADFGNKSAYVWGLNNGFTSTDPIYDYQFSSNSFTANFENTYLFADNFQDIVDKKATHPNFSYHFGVAKLFKVMCMDYITALYGDAPYSQAFSRSNSTPKYDDDKAIIPALFAELDEAKAYLNADPSVTQALGSEDIVFHGDTTLWLKYVETIELKLALRLSKTTDPALVALRNSRFALLDATQNFVNQDVTVNPGYNETTLAQRTPVFRVYGRDEAFAAWTSANRANAAGDFAARLLNGTINDGNITTGLVDPRRARIFTLAPVVGNVQGIFPPAEISRVASFYFGRLGSSVPVADANASGRNAYLMLAAESYFLQAEAFQRGFLSGDAHQAFNDGITASFAFYSTPWGNLTAANIPPINPVTYIANIDAKNGLGWTGSADKISAIMTQKYIALANWHGIELYLDHLRTGFPVLPLPFGVLKANRPNRLIYPSSEYSSNSGNVPAVSNDELFTVNSKTPYYLQ